MASASDDRRWMEYALRLGRRALGTTAENPAVGCVIVKDGRVLGVGCTQASGRPHAEVMALLMAGAGAEGATAYVTLEPCSHHGQTPPCADALIEARIARVVAATGDPNPRVSGQGLARLRAAGLAVAVGVVEEEARASHAGFFTRILENRPYVILKLAISADDKIAAGPGQRTPISGEEVGRRVHLMRAQSDAILVGMATVLADDPELTVRLPGLEHRSPKPFVLGRGPLPPHSKLAARGAEVFPGPATEFIHDLAGRGINRLMVEGGARTARAFLEAGLVDEFHLFTSPRSLGAGGVDALVGLSLAEAVKPFQQTSEEALGDDRLTVYVKKP